MPEFFLVKMEINLETIHEHIFNSKALAFLEIELEGNLILEVSFERISIVKH